VALANVLIRKGTNLDFKTARGPPFIFSATNACEEIAIDAVWAETNLDVTYSGRWTPLMNAVDQMEFTVVRALAQAGANLDK
jgi:hypothetical protein